MAPNAPPRVTARGAVDHRASTVVGRVSPSRRGVQLGPRGNAGGEPQTHPHLVGQLVRLACVATAGTATAARHSVHPRGTGTTPRQRRDVVHRIGVPTAVRALVAVTDEDTTARPPRRVAI